MTRSTFYITTAIDYVNSLPHIGTAYEKIGADVLARFMRLKGADVRFQMGNDEHSINVLKSAQKEGLDPLDYCNRMEKKFVDVWKKLDISYDDFIRTTSPRHVKGLQLLTQKIHAAGDIYKSSYEGWYCESCEAFLTDKDLVGGECPHHLKKPEWIREENYFFALSKYAPRLLEHIRHHPEFILPESRRNEIIRLIEGGLEDISVSRAGFKWGVELPFDPEHMIYVWTDALTNYITAVGFGSNPEEFNKWWPADLHVIGKDITRFHSVIWPAMLMSAGLPLPKTIFGHGFVYLKGEKMSKSLGNVVTPLDVIDHYGSDALRYYLLRDASFGRDADFTWDNFIHRYNSDLANGLGNLVSRTSSMIDLYFKGLLAPSTTAASTRDSQLQREVTGALGRIASYLDYRAGDIQFHMALHALMEAVSATDRYINESKPWELFKRGESSLLQQVLYHVTEAIRLITLHATAFIPKTAALIWSSFGFQSIAPLSNIRLSEHNHWQKIITPLTVAVIKNLFPRIDAKPQEMPMTTPPSDTQPTTELLDISDFAKITLKVALVESAEKVEGADKLLKLIVNLGDEKRQIVAGIAKHYSPETLIGKHVVVVANLKPAKLRGVESHGMLLAASDADEIILLSPEKAIAPGSRVK